LDIIPRYGGVIIHDCWASYLSYDHCGHGLCGSHLLRELTFIIDSNQC
ncbi:MAG: transposase, partial [Desulfobacteraceae bacterium]|nr:transposase [Desulfobacteraceae bacterium]